LRILLLGADTPVGHSLRAFIPPLQRHDLLLTSLEATRWQRPRMVKKLLKTSAPDLIVDARAVSQVDFTDADLAPELERSQWIAETVGKLGSRYVLLSSSRVFHGGLKRPYRESDAPDAISSEGRFLIQTEQLMADHIEPLFVLRLGWIFSGRGPGAFSRMLDSFRRGDTVYASDNRRDCPVHTAEVARVVAGIIDQISVGAPPRGTYHYGSDGDTGWFAFAEAVVAYASQFDTFANATELLQEGHGAEAAHVNRALDCTAIRHQFGIQRRPWRDFIERAVRRYIELYSEA